MTGKMKVMGLALLAALAVSAVGASGASAERHDLFSENQNTVITGTQDDESGTNTGTGIQRFTRGSANIDCHEVHFEGTQVGKTNTGSGWETDTIELTAEYTTDSCVGPANSEVHVDFTTDECGYHYTMTADTTAVTKLTCAKGEKKVRITPTVFGASLCTISIPAQTYGGHILLHNVDTEGKDAITAGATLTGIQSIRVGNSLCGPASNETGTFSGNILLKGYEDLGAEVHPLYHGELIDIEVTPISENQNTVITGTQDDESGTNTETGIQRLTRGSARIDCHEVHFEGTSTGVAAGNGWETDTIELTAEYTTDSCVGPVNSEVHVDFTTDECGYHFTITADTTAVTKLACAKGEQKVRITPTAFGSSLCTISLPAQTPDGHVMLHNVDTEGKGAITTEATLTGIDSTRVGSALCGPASYAAATFTGNILLKGYQGLGDIAHPLHHGELIDIEVTHTG